MKKILTTLAVGAILATTASADMARLEMGAGAWAQEPSGVISYTDTTTGFPVTASDTSDKSEETGAYVWMFIKHPIPVLPNIRLEYANVESAGTADGSFEDFTATGAATSLTMAQYDIIPYYNLLDNTAWMTIDLGLDIKVIDMDYQADDVTGWTSTTYTESEMLYIPLLYLRGRVEIPGTDIGFEADGKYVTYDDSTIYDIRAKIDYTFSSVPVVEPAIEVGYRIQKYDVSDDGSLPGSTAKMDMEFSGIYAGLMLRF